MKRLTLVNEHMNQVIWAGGLPIRRGDYIAILDEFAKEQDPQNWLRLRDAVLMGNYQFNKKHGYPPPDTQPYTREQFKRSIRVEMLSKLLKSLKKQNMTIWDEALKAIE